MLSRRALATIHAGFLAACLSGTALAYDFSVSNEISEPIEVAVAYETDTDKTNPQPSGDRTINGFFVIPPSQTAKLFTYNNRLNAAWVMVRSGTAKTIWRPQNIPFFDINANQINCSQSDCWVSNFPDFYGDTAVTQTIFSSVVTNGLPLHMIKIVDTVDAKSIVFRWIHPLPTGPKICNQLTKPMNAAIGYFSKDKQTWVASGWYPLSPGACTPVITDINERAYGFATDNGLKKAPASKPATFCVDRQATFSLPFDACQKQPNPNYRNEVFGLIETAADGSITWNISP